ncbi:MAG: hypothetical protein WA979_12675 [Pacificimonas sp.]
MTAEIGAAALSLSNLSATGAAASPMNPAAMPAAASLTDIGNFAASMERAAASSGKDMVSPVMESVMETLGTVDAHAKSIAIDANQLAASGADLTPSQMIDLTVRSQQFMFHCQLTSNVANRTSDGLSQLFRQQS